MKRAHLLHALGLLAGCAAFALALGLLHRELRHYDLREILATARATPLRRILAACACTIGSYLLLTFYDVLALHHIGRKLPYRKVAVTSFTSYVTSHNLGLSGIGGTAVRYRLYTAFGLSAVEITEVVAFCSLTFWVGFLTLGSLVFLLEPVALPEVLHAAVDTTQPLGVVFLALALAFFGWAVLWKRPLRWREWGIDPPSGRSLLLQFPLAALDWTLAAAVLHASLPAGHDLSFLQVFSVFLAAQTAGMVSHVPAGLGVFETVVIYLLPGGIPTPELASALLVYRAIYYLCPLALGAGLLLGVEAFLRRAELAALRRWVAPFAETILPRVLAFTTSLAGAVLLLTGALPSVGQRMSWIQDVVPLPLVELSHFLGSLVGAALLLLAHGLLRRIDAAWWACVLLLAAGVVFALARGLDYEDAGLVVVLFLALLPFRRVFYRRASLLHLPMRWGWMLEVLMVLASALWLGFLSFRHVEYSNELWWHFSYAGDAPRFLRASVGVVGLLAVVSLARLLKPVPPRLPLPGTSDLALVRAILAREPETLGHLALLGDKHLLFDDAHSSFVMFAIHDTSWVALGDPVGGTPETKKELVWRFREDAELGSGRAVFYQVKEETLGWYAEAGFSLLKVGEEALVDLGSFSLEGSAHKGLRSNAHRLEREGCTFAVLPPEEARARLDALQAISDAWLCLKETQEKGFSLGSFRRDYVASGPVAVVQRGEETLAFANVWLGAPGGELSIDLMRALPDAPGGLMDLLFARLLEWGRAQGYRTFSLGMAPLSGLETRATAPFWNRAANLIYQHGEHFYNFQGLRQYKAKFDPLWKARYLASPGGLALPRALLDVTALISRGAGGAPRG